MGRGPSGRVAGVVATMLVAALVAAGCGGSGGATSTSATTGSGSMSPTESTPTGTSTSAKPTSTSPSPTPTTTTKKKKKKNVIAWVLSLGPGAPEGPPEFTAYRELQQLHCSKVFDRVGELKKPAVTLYTGAAQACLAAFSGRSNLWARAAKAYDEVSGRSGELTCMDRAALALLKRLVTAHEADPEAVFEKAPGSASKAPPCPDISRLSPDHGAAGQTVRITGRNLARDVDEVRVYITNDNFVEAEKRVDGDAIEFTMPVLAAEALTVCVVVRARPEWSADGAIFTYESAESTGPASPAAFDACPPPEVA
ncbi:MAG TPA: IPT/TIG domain-containing protein [Actinomycetes bacterium]